MAEQQDSGLLREIDEELRHERIKSLAKAYGKYVFAVAVILIGGVGGYKGWQNYDQNLRMEETSAYIRAVTLADDGDPAGAAEAIEKMVASGSGSIDEFADLRRAGFLAESGDKAGAEAVYRALAGDQANDADVRALASINLGALLLDSGDSSGARIAVLPFNQAGNPWMLMAREIIALADLESGDIESARTILDEIAVAEDTPRGLRERALLLLNTLPPQEETSPPSQGEDG